MQNVLIKASVLFFVTVALLCGAPVMAESAQMTDAEIDLLLAQYLPEDFVFEQDADQADQLDVLAVQEAIANAVHARPDNVVQIAARAAQRWPSYASAIAASAAVVYPNQFSNIVAAVSGVVPEQAIAIRNAVAKAFMENRQKVGEEVLKRALRLAEQAGSAPPVREERPASPVR